MGRNMSRMEYIKLSLKKEVLEKQLEDYRVENIKPLTKILIENFVNFDELCMSMSKFDMKLSFREIASLSVYEFYRLNSFIRKTNKPKSQRNQDE